MPMLNNLTIAPDSIVIDGVNKTFTTSSVRRNETSQGLQTLWDVHFGVGANQFVSLVGPSGCGKSTLLKMIAGVDRDYEGRILVEGRDVRKERVPVCYMLQRDYLMPWRTLMQNVLLPVEIEKGDLKAAREKVMPLLEEFGLSGFENYRPHALSGGMRQRAALLRTYLMKGSIMLLDEPFGALDELTRIKMQNWLTGVWEKRKKTVLFVTHNIEEAVYLSDRILVMSQRPGHITGDIKVELPRPRRREMSYDKVFMEYRKEVLGLLEG